MLPELAQLFRQPGRKPASTPLDLFLRKLGEWRNEELGHGAFRLDIPSFRADLRELVSRLNELLADESVAGVWGDAWLTVGAKDGPRLHGYRTVRKNTDKTVDFPESRADSGAFDAPAAPIDSDLSAIVIAWPTLPTALKAGILAMVRATGGGG